MQIGEHRIYQIFRISLILKGLHALIEIIGGLLLYLTSAHTILHWVNVLTQKNWSRIRATL